MTGRINPAIVSLLVGRQPKERLRLIDARSPIASTYLGTTQQITRVQHVRYDRCVNKKNEGLVGSVCGFSMTSAKLSADSVDEEKKSLVKAGNDSFGK
ncbi:MAG: hypothetical protein SOX40_01980 [Bacteroidaceae bacterium]|nr:hypothetical protein [Bacteroidaceae bacterium]